MTSFSVHDIVKIENFSLFSMKHDLGYSRTIKVTMKSGEQTEIVLFSDTLDALDVPAKGEATNVR